MCSEKSVCLQVKDVGLTFGGVRALGGVSFDVKSGEMLALIGPNGAGKTSLINCISGFYHPTEGEIWLGNHDLTHVSRQGAAAMGVARTFQNIALFNGLTVLNNLMVARHMFTKGGLFSSIVYFGLGQREDGRQRQVVETIIDMLHLEAVRNKTVGSLPYGLRKRVELGRVLALEPRLLLLDEPAAGMSMEEKEDLVRFVLDIWQEKALTIILVEHDMGVVMDIADRVVVLDFGAKIADGTPEQVRKDEKVLKAYLGTRQQSKTPDEVQCQDSSAGTTHQI